ncbi:MAG: FAD-dependent monooxygenase [Gammaproteobacteria bacterium]|nr:FAD-dependent monooxygenase [Gammaproteobacteria bacterium]
MTSASADVLIVGGGLVGLTLATLLRQQGDSGEYNVAVVEPRPPEPPGATLGLRVSALSPASQDILENCHVWQNLPATRLGPYVAMRVWRGGGPDGSQSIRFDAAEQGLPALGHIVENELLRWELWQRAEALGVELLTAAELVSAQRDERRVLLEFDDGRTAEARLVVGADGARSRVREAFGLSVRRRGYGQQGVVTHVASSRSHQETAWQRFLSDGPVALLPLADGRSSVVWSCPDQRATALLSSSGDDFGHELTRVTQRVLGDLSVTVKPRAFPLVAAHAPHYCDERVVLVGDAAHQVHPLAGQGVNLGLLDAAELASRLIDQQSLRYADPGDKRLLRGYERARKPENLLTLTTMDLFHRVFDTGNPLLSSAGGAGLAVADRLPAVKRRLAAQALGGGSRV